MHVSVLATSVLPNSLYYHARRNLAFQPPPNVKYAATLHPFLSWSTNTMLFYEMALNILLEIIDTVSLFPSSCGVQAFHYVSNTTHPIRGMLLFAAQFLSHASKW